MSIAFRPYQTIDKEACIQIFRSNIPRFFLHHEESDFVIYLDQQINRDYWCIEVQDQVIGCGGIHVKSCGTARLVWGMVRMDLHKNGYGRALLEYRLKQLASLSQVKTVELDTTQHHPEFFKKFGFHEFKITENKYGPGLHSHEMTLHITPELRKLWCHDSEYSS